MLGHLSEIDKVGERGCQDCVILPQFFFSPFCVSSISSRGTPDKKAHQAARIACCRFSAFSIQLFWRAAARGGLFVVLKTENNFKDENENGTTKPTFATIHFPACFEPWIADSTAHYLLDPADNGSFRVVPLEQVSASSLWKVLRMSSSGRVTAKEANE